MNDFAKLMASFAADNQADDQDETTHPIDPRAQAMELRDRFRRAAITTGFMPGMLCREKRGMGMLKRAPLVMFWRWLDPADPQDAALIDQDIRKHYRSRTDCLIGFIDKDGDLLLAPNESWRLEACDAAFPEDDGA